MKIKSYFLVLLFTAACVSCGNEADSVPDQPVFQVTLVNEIPVETLRVLALLAGGPDIAARVEFGVKTYKVIYKTNYKGSTVNASGLIYLPQGLTTKAPLISLQHGTLFLKSDAPTLSSELTGLEFFASAGYIAMEADYIGYGETADLFHPYYDEEHSASAVIDLILETKKYLDAQRIGYNDKLFLAGYSEGGYVTLATAKALETNKTYNLDVTAVAAGAGGYDLTQMLESITTNTTYAYPAYLAFVLMSYNTTYDWDRPLDDFFAPPYAAALSTYMNGSYDGGEINSHLTTDVEALLDPDFRMGLSNTEGETELKEALVNNSVAGWRTTLPVRLYHGVNDEIIPLSNSQITLQKFKDAGSTQVTLTTIPSGTHGSSLIPMLTDCIPWFETF